MYNDKLHKDLREKKITLRFRSRICLSKFDAICDFEKKKRKNKETKKKL